MGRLRELSGVTIENCSHSTEWIIIVIHFDLPQVYDGVTFTDFIFAQNNDVTLGAGATLETWGYAAHLG